MAIPAGFARYVLSGTLGNTEIFETGFWADMGTITDQASADDAAATEAANVVTDWGPISLLMSTESVLNEVKVYCYPAGGPTSAFIGSAPVAGVSGGSATLAAEQLCLVATLLTGLAGRRHRGRMYLPANGISGLVGDHEVPNSTVSNAAEALALHLGRFSGGAVVLSQTASSAVPITAVRIDNRLDIQRRRANKQTPTFKHTANL